MIDKYIDNTTIPATYTTTVQGDNRQFLAKLLINGTEISGDIVKIQVTKGSCGTLDGFSLGSVVSSTMVADIKNLATSVKGQTIECQIGLNISGTYKYVTLGHFTVSEAKKTLYTTTITAFGATVSATSGAFTAPVSPTLANIASEIATETGCTVTFDTGITTSQTIDYPMTGMTTYQALQALAEAVGGYACDTYDGNIAIRKYSTTPTLTVYARLMRNLPLVEETDFEITGIQMRTPADLYTSGAPINLSGYSNYVTQTLFNNEVADIVGYQYRPGTIGLTLGDPRIEGNDVLTVTDADNNTYTVPCHMVTHSYTGGFSTEIVSATATALENDIGTSLPISGQIDDIKEDASEAKADASNALSIATNTDQYFWFTSMGTDTGAHITEIPQSKFTDPNDPLYQTGGNLLANSNGIAVRNGMTELSVFGATEAQIGQTSSTHTIIDGNGHRFYSSGGGLMANIGYGDANGIGGVSQFPYFAFGISPNSGNTYDPTATYSIGDLCVYNDIDYVCTTDITTPEAWNTNHWARILGSYSFAEGYKPIASGAYAHAENSTATGNYSHAEGRESIASGYVSHAEGEETVASGGRSHAEGSTTTASGNFSHAEGWHTTASGAESHSEGLSSTASGEQSHAEGSHTTASGDYSHAEGGSTVASGIASHASGTGTVAGYMNQTAIGAYNANQNTTYFEIGNGTADNARSNAFTVDWYGNVVASGGIHSNQDVTSRSGKSLEDSVQSSAETLSGNSNKTYSLENNTRGLLVVMGANSSVRGLYIYNTSSNGTVGTSTVLSASGITLTAGANSLSISNSTTTSAILWFLSPNTRLPL
jgi:hypothetical protein